MRSLQYLVQQLGDKGNKVNGSKDTSERLHILALSLSLSYIGFRLSGAAGKIQGCIEQRRETGNGFKVRVQGIDEIQG
jgi:hypothetical protein